jgi:DNA invertase Pin-like site-specific DNA recombinase
MSVAIGYARVSTLGQASEGVSLEAQRAKIEAWCAANDRTLGAFHVDAISGKRADNRPELQKALDAICGWKKKDGKTRRRGDAQSDSGSFSASPRPRVSASSSPPVLVVYSLSRLARSVRDTLQIADRLDKAGADLVSLSEKLDTTSAAGRMIFRLLAVLAEFERELIGERTKAAMQHMRAEGKRVGGIPYGFGLDPDGQTLCPITHEQDAIDQMLAWREAGHTLRGIAAALLFEGIASKKGGRWHAQNISEILKRFASRPARDPGTPPAAQRAASHPEAQTAASF